MDNRPEHTRVEFSHKPLWYCGHTHQMLFSYVEDGGFPMPELMQDGEWSEMGTGQSQQGRPTWTIYLKRDGVVVGRRQILPPHCVKFGRYGTIDYMRGMFLLHWLVGLELVFVQPGGRRSQDCKQFDEAMSPDNTWRVPDENLVPNA